MVPITAVFYTFETLNLLTRMDKRQITLKDIAKALNLSPSTVSRAMKDHPAISEETRRIVKSYASAHKYKPNTLAMQLRTNRNNTLGVIVPAIVHYFFSTVLAGIQDEAEAEGYNLIFCHSDERQEREVKSVQTLLDARVCGVLASLSKTTVDSRHFQELLDNNVQLVFFDRICADLNTDKVVVDDYAGAFKAVEHLVLSGCKRIAYLGASRNLPINNNRRLGYEDALKKHKIAVDSELIKVCDVSELVKEIVPPLFDTPNPPDALFCINDEVAAYCLDELRKLQLRVPEDVSVCGFTNSYITEVTNPKLTTVDQHGYEMGKIATRLLINRIEGRETKSGVVNKLVKTELVIRDSTR